MLEISALLTTALVILFGWLLVNKLLKSKWKNLPPGPVGLPVIGNLHQLAKGGKPLQVIQQWKDKYGDVLGLQLGKYRVVILSGYETIKEGYSMMEFSGRPLIRPFEEISGGEKLGLVLSEGQPWVEQRRFALRNLRDFGFGKKSMESFIHEDITELLESFKELEGTAFVPHRKFSTAVVKSLWNIIAGERFSYGDPKFQKILDVLHGIIASTSLTGPVLFLPWLATLFPGVTGWTKIRVAIGKARSFVGEYIQSHRETYQGDGVRDLIDAYLKEIEGTQDPNSSFYKETGHKHMLVAMLNLFGAGAETTSNTLVWALYFMIQYPQVQKKLYEEVSTVCGKSRLPSLEDRDSCLYTWAVMEEILRLSSLTPLGVFHNTMSDITFKNHFIPKDTIVLANLYGVHYDKTKWGDDVEVFRPERFLIEDNDKFKKNTNAGICIPFSVGKRACLGEILARNNFFLYLTSMVQRFEIRKGDESLDVGVTPSLIRSPTEFSIIVKER